jgi:PAS domain S-box-containing protein
MSGSVWRSAAAVAFVYLLFATLWIVFSDRAVALVAGDLDRVTALQTVKGLVFVTLSSLLIFVLVFINTGRLSDLHAANLRMEREQAGMLEMINDGVWLIDRGEARVQWRGRWQALSGYAPEDLGTVDHWLGHIHSDDRGGFAELLDALVRGTVDSLEHEHRLRAASGVWLSVRANARLMDIGETGAEATVVGTYTDLTALRQQEQRLSALAHDLGESRADLETLAAAAAHDLRQPVREIASFAQLLRRRLGDGLPAEADEDMMYFVAAARHLDSLLDGLMQAVEAARAGVSRSEVALTPLLRSCTASYEAELEAVGGTVRIDPLPVVSGDAGQLALLFDALMSNAVKFRASDRPLEVAVTAERDGPWWRIAVTDNGIGLPDEHLDEVFKVFRRLHGRAAYPGSGMGLAICRIIALHHGGTIRAERLSGPGARLVVSLPAEGGA